MTHSDEPSELQPEQPSEHAGSSEAGSSEDMKKKFREALERKNSRHHATVEANSGSKISHAHGSASQKREFRRKSG
jgi:Family of unknown function (DUF5302)